MSADTIAPTKKSLFRSHPLLMVAVLTIASFMEILDAGIANVALPTISGSLAVSPEEASLITSSYLMANAVIVPITGWLSTYFGRKNLYITCVIIFIAASVLCGFSTNLEMLVFFRVIQGLGGGNLIAIEQAYIADSVPAEQRGTAFSMYGATLVCAPVFAPALGGWITDNYGWHWIFFINVPIGLVSIFLVSTLIKESKSVTEAREKLRRSGQRIDWLGILLIMVGIAALTIVLDKGNRKGWFESDFIVFFAIVAFVALIAGVAWELTHDNPAVDIRLLTNRYVGGGTVLVFVIAVMIYGNSVMIPLFAQNILGFSAKDSGMINTVGGLVSLTMIPIAGLMLKRVDARFLAVFGLSFSAFAVWNMTLLNLDAGYWDMAFIRGMQTLGGAFLFAPVTLAAFRGVPEGQTDSASSLITTAASLGGSLGIALLTMTVTNKTQHHVVILSEQASTYDPNYVSWLSQTTKVLQDRGMSAIEAAETAKQVIWSEIQLQAGVLGFIDTFYFLLFLIICVIPLVFLLKPGIGKSK